MKYCASSSAIVCILSTHAETRYCGWKRDDVVVVIVVAIPLRVIGIDAPEIFRDAMNLMSNPKRGSQEHTV